VEQLLKSTPATLELTHYNGDTLADLDADPTVVVVDDQGNSVSAGAVSKASTGVYRSTIATPSTVTTLTATWTGAYSSTAVTLTQQYEVVGNLLFALGELRAYKSTLTSNDDKLVEARNITAALFETWCNVSFISRPGYENVAGNGRTRLPLAKRQVTAIRAVEMDGSAVTVDSFEEHGALNLVNGWTLPTDLTRNIEVWYAHGYTQTPADIKRAAMEYAAYLLLSDVSTVDQRATGFTNELGLVVRYSPHMPTGLPSVDSTLARYKMPAIGRR
jgi:hypothetical protein